MMTDDELEAIRARADGGIEYRGSTDALAAIHDRRDLLIEVDRLRAVVASRPSEALRAMQAAYCGQAEADPVPPSSRSVTVRLDGGPWDGQTDEISPSAIVLSAWSIIGKVAGRVTDATYRPTGRMGDDNLPIWACDPADDAFKAAGVTPEELSRFVLERHERANAGDPADEPSGETWRDRKPLL